MSVPLGQIKEKSKGKENLLKMSIVVLLRAIQQQVNHGTSLLRATICWSSSLIGLDMLQNLTAALSQMWKPRLGALGSHEMASMAEPRLEPKTLFHSSLGLLRTKTLERASESQEWSWTPQPPRWVWRCCSKCRRIPPERTLRDQRRTAN